MMSHRKRISAVGPRPTALGCLAECRWPIAVGRDPFLWLAIVMAFGLSADPAFAQREVRIRTVAETPLPFVTTVIAPAARHVAVNDVAGVVAVGHRPKSPAHVSLFRLDAQGQIVAGEPVTITLPKPAALEPRPNYVLAMLCHPRLPLLYVWQDVEPLPENAPTDSAVSAEFDHLLIYSLEEPQPKLIMATARGTDFSCGAAAGAMAFSPALTRLYVPNMQQVDRMKKIASTVGWFVLDPDGLPAFAPPNAPTEEATTPSTSPPPLDIAAAAAARTTKLAAIEQAKAAGQPLVLRKYMEATSTFSGGPPIPYSYAPLNDDAIFVASHSGPASWVLSDRLGHICYFYLQPYVAYRYRVALHPTAPSVYIATLVYDGRINRMEHADGQFTLAPQTLSVDNFVYYSTPLVLPKSNQLAIGANGRVCLIDLAADGKFKTNAVQMTVNNPTVEAIVWSPKFEKLYVPVEKTP
jgi:hypothetical protein